MKPLLIKNARIVNEGRIQEGDVLIKGSRIEKVSASIMVEGAVTEIDAHGKFLIPGAIDDQVHFREPCLTHKGTISSESRAAAAGGITSFIEQPNTVPNAVTLDILEEKYEIAKRTAHVNYSFMLGATNNNIDEVKALNPETIAGVKIFMGSSTGNMLVDQDRALEDIFVNSPAIIAVHCEDEETVQRNLAHYKSIYGENIPVQLHPQIRSAEACFKSSSKAISLAKKTGAKLHIFHLSTAAELELLDNSVPLAKKKITAEACVHHLWFSDEDYTQKGNFIKWNPAVKTAQDRDALWAALHDGRIDVIATDHAPHTLEEKGRSYLEAPSGGPLVQHAVTAMFEKAAQGKITVERIVEKMCHNPAILFNIRERGFIREGYFADMALVDPDSSWTVSRSNILYHCGWSPFEGTRFRSRVTHTFVNGVPAFEWNAGVLQKNASRIMFDR